MKKPTGNYSRPHKKGEKPPKMQGSQRAAMFLLLGVGILMGYNADRMSEKTFGKTTSSITEFAQQAHELYSSQEQNSVELTAVDKAQIQTWFSKAVKRNFIVPNLENFGLEFVGARLTIAETKPAAYLLYIDDNDTQLAYYITRSKPSKSNLPNQLTWHDDSYGHVLVSKVELSKLEKIATQIRGL